MSTLAKWTHRRHFPLIWTLTIALEWKMEDFWIGVFWRRVSKEPIAETGIDVWICIVPCLPIHIAWLRDCR